MSKPLFTGPGPDRGRDRQADVKSMLNEQMPKNLFGHLDFIRLLNSDI
jgi:hypothetical protein